MQDWINPGQRAETLPSFGRSWLQFHNMRLLGFKTNTVTVHQPARSFWVPLLPSQISSFDRVSMLLVPTLYSQTQSQTS